MSEDAVKLAVLCVACATLFSAAARADTAACVAASDAGQKLRDEGRLVESRAQFVTCAHEDCPGPVRGDCVRWMQDVERRVPTIVIAATSAGRDTSDVRVSIDGTLVKSHLDGGAIPLDPGEHRLRYEHAGDPPSQETIVLREGEKDRALRVRFGSLVVAPPTRPTLAWAMTATAAAGFVGFALLAITGYSTIQACKSDGASCNVASHQSETLTEFVFGDIGLVVGLVTAGIATWAFIQHAQHAHPRAMGFDPARAAFVF
ncbi:MAG TPA: hypothetical protein VGH28_03150 [Polyangiaceae bacterium]|jgi:hypothetical protein